MSRTTDACNDFRMTRRHFVPSALGLLGLSLGECLGLRAAAASASHSERSFGRARSCIVFFAWGGMSQLETWDPKPDAPAETRGTYRPIATVTPGIQLGEYMPTFARHTERLAIVRSVHHKEAGHRNAAYWNLTGHEPHRPGNDESIPPSRRDWPSLGSMVARFRRPPRGFPGTVALPYPVADRGLLNGQFGGFLGMGYDPFILRPSAGQPYAGVSPSSGVANLDLPTDVQTGRMRERLKLLEQEEKTLHASSRGEKNFDHYQQMAIDLLLRSEVSAALDLNREPQRIRDRYGDHLCGQSALLARRLTEAGVPIVTVYASAGDLNGSSGDNWDTHGDNFRRLKNRLLPPLERASSALLDDLAARGRLDETLVVWLTEFGRTPRLNGGSGRDHYPHCYSVAFAGGGIRGGQVYGRSDRIASKPADRPCTPPDLHATIFHALGIPLDSPIEDALGRRLPLTEGHPLPLFG